MKQFYSLSFFLIVFFGKQTATAQQSLSIAEGPVYTISCDSSCTMLHANFPKSLRSNIYSTSTIPYALQTTTGTPIALNDDKFSGAIPLGFDFCFYENVYNTCYVSDNGVLTFNPQYANGSCNNNTQQLFPYFNSTTPDNAIYFLYMDAAPQLGGSINYTTIGTAPNRKFILNYQNMKIFGATCSNTTSSYQVVLNESNFSIEVFITNKVVCDANATNIKNYSTIGIQSVGATNFLPIPTKHAASFTATNEGYKFTPAGAPNYNLQWFDHNNVLIASNQDSIYVCPPFYPYSKIKAKISYFCPVGQYEDTVRIIKNEASISSVTLGFPNCPSDSSGTIIVTGGGNPPYIYAINTQPYSTNNSFANLTSGVYTLHVKDASNCVKDTIISLPALTNPSVILDTFHKPTCPDSTGFIQVHAVNGVPPYQYVWNTGTVGPTISGLYGGFYTVVVTDANGCVFSLLVDLTAFGLPNISGVVVNPVCGDSSGSITLTVTGAIPPYSYQWSNNDTTSSLNNLPAGSYGVFVVDSIGCAQSQNFNLINILNVLSQPSVTHTQCNLPNGSASPNVSGSLAPYTYQWQPSGQTTATAINLASGTHTVVSTAANGCKRTDIITVNASLATQNVMSPANANCDTSNGKVLVPLVLNSAPPLQYVWSTSAISQNLIDLWPGTYWVKTTDANGCVDSDTVTLVNDGVPFLNVVAYTPPSCFGDSTASVTLDGFFGIAPYKYSVDGVNFQSFATLNGIPGGTYPIYISDANSCVNDTLVNFWQPTQILHSYTSDTIVCFNDVNADVSFAASGGFPPYLYSFNGGNFENQQTRTGLGSGTYPISIQDSNNCIRNFSIVVPGPAEELRVLIDKKDVPCYEDSTGYADITILGGWSPYSYYYSNPNWTGLLIDSIDVSHEVMYITDDKGCQIEANIDVTDNYCCTITVPNAFSPNDDGRNDRLRFLTRSEFFNFQVKIFNRWGEMVYESRNHLDSWDGKIRNQPAAMGTYVYYMEYTCTLTQKKVFEKGDITLVR